MYNVTKKDLIDFEQRIVNLFEDGQLPYLLHLSGGNEDELISIFRNISEGDYILSTHRSHYHYLLAGGDPYKLERMIYEGNSMFIFDKKLNFLTSSVLAGMPPIATGIDLSLKMKGSNNKVWCFIGDGAEDEGNFYEAVRIVDGRDLPCTFIIEDNDRSVETKKKDRYGKDFQWPSCVKRYTYKCTFPHAGTGTGNMVTFKR